MAKPKPNGASCSVGHNIAVICKETQLRPSDDFIWHTRPRRCFRDSNWSAALLLQNQVTITSTGKPKLCLQLMFYFSWPLSVQPWPNGCPTFIYSFMILAKACLLLLRCQFQSGVNHLNINKLHINVEQFYDRHHTLGKAQICQFMRFLQNETQACMVLQNRIQNWFFFNIILDARELHHTIFNHFFLFDKHECTSVTIFPFQACF